jgi:putative ubiquitin-RnfH superfamily antitoxin RatB of RatAB toxin-antitoxin module
MAASEAPIDGNLAVCVVFAEIATVWHCELTLAIGATVNDAIAASGFSAAHPGSDPWSMGVGIFGRVVRPDTLLAAGDRIEIYRPLTFDPTVSRRRRALHRDRRNS